MFLARFVKTDSHFSMLFFACCLNAFVVCFDWVLFKGSEQSLV